MVVSIADFGLRQDVTALPGTQTMRRGGVEATTPPPLNAPFGATNTPEKFREDEEATGARNGGWGGRRGVQLRKVPRLDGVIAACGVQPATVGAERDAADQ